MREKTSAGTVSERGQTARQLFGGRTFRYDVRRERVNGTADEGGEVFFHFAFVEAVGEAAGAAAAAFRRSAQQLFGA